MVYEIEVTRGPNTWQIEKRYRQFHAFGEYLQTIGLFSIVNKLPPKTLFSSSARENHVIEYRMQRLSDFIHELLQAINNNQSLKLNQHINSFFTL